MKYDIYKNKDIEFFQQIENYYEELKDKHELSESVEHLHSIFNKIPCLKYKHFNVNSVFDLSDSNGKILSFEEVLLCIKQDYLQRRCFSSKLSDKQKSYFINNLKGEITWSIRHLNIINTVLSKTNRVFDFYYDYWENYTLREYVLKLIEDEKLNGT